MFLLPTLDIAAKVMLGVGGIFAKPYRHLNVTEQEEVWIADGTGSTFLEWRERHNIGRSYYG